MALLQRTVYGTGDKATKSITTLDQPYALLNHFTAETHLSKPQDTKVSDTYVFNRVFYIVSDRRMHDFGLDPVTQVVRRASLFCATRIRFCLIRLCPVWPNAATPLSCH